MMKKVHDESLDVRTIVILVGHDHEVSISQLFDTVVLLCVLYIRVFCVDACVLVCVCMTETMYLLCVCFTHTYSSQPYA